jgi:hypothetical protein
LQAGYGERYKVRIKILPSLLLIFLLASCASYHDGNRKGIFLKNDAPGTVVYAEGKIDSDNKEKLNSKLKEKMRLGK